MLELLAVAVGDVDDVIVASAVVAVLDYSLFFLLGSVSQYFVFFSCLRFECKLSLLPNIN